MSAIGEQSDNQILETGVPEEIEMLEDIEVSSESESDEIELKSESSLSEGQLSSEDDSESDSEVSDDDYTILKSPSVSDLCKFLYIKEKTDENLQEYKVYYKEYQDLKKDGNIATFIKAYLASKFNF
jgi:hypothetical protein